MDNDCGISKEDLEKICGGTMSGNDVRDLLGMMTSYKEQGYQKDDFVDYIWGNFGTLKSKYLSSRSECTMSEFIAFVENYWYMA
ncbi:MAG: hypothetical protein J6Z43_05145 [Clostridiales bacterium]|nr:hypothetical protein [Clostridiales bacterium]